MNELMNELFRRVHTRVGPELASRTSWADDGGDEAGWQVLLLLDGGSTRHFVGFDYKTGWEKEVSSLGECWWESVTIDSLADSVAALYELRTREVPDKLPY